MNRIHLISTLCLVVACCMSLAEDKKKAFLNAESAGIDFEIQGEYSAKIEGGPKIGIQVMAQGDGKFDAVVYHGGLPGDGWDSQAGPKILASGEVKEGICILRPTKTDNPDVDMNNYAEIKDGTLTLFHSSNQKVAELQKVVRKSPTAGAKPPEGAVVLFDGSSVDAWKNGRLTDDKLLKEGCTSKAVFQNYKLHLEFQLSFMPWGRGQGRANSGCYNQGRYEVQILDSFGLSGENNECGGIYTIAKPKVNMCFPPLSWQTYDIDFHAAEFDEKGQKTSEPWMTVRHNGIVIHEKQELPNRTRASPLKDGPEAGPIFLQNHGNPIRFRNIWVQPISETASAK